MAKLYRIKATVPRRTVHGRPYVKEVYGVASWSDKSGATLYRSEVAFKQYGFLKRISPSSGWELEPANA